MAQLCQRHKLRHVTFPLSAVHTMQAPGPAERLLSLSPDYTLTLWGEADAPVRLPRGACRSRAAPTCPVSFSHATFSPPQVQHFARHFHADRCYVDIQPVTLLWRVVWGTFRALGLFRS